MSQFYVGFNSSESAVTSVTGTNGVTATPTTGNVVVSGVNATTTTVGVASFNPADFTVSGSGEVTLISTGGVNSVTGSGSVTATPTTGNVVVGLTGITQYDILIGGATNTIANVTNGTNGQVLTANTGAAPTWQAASSGSAQLGVYGDGSDGTQTFDGITTILGIVPTGTAGNYFYTLARDIFLQSSTIDSGVSIVTNGFRFFCQGTLTNNGTIEWNGNAGVTGGIGGAGLTNANVFTGTFGFGGSGATGTGSSSNNQSANPFGGPGGNGGAGASGGGAAGTITPSVASKGSLRSIPQSVTGILLYSSSNGSVSTGTGGGGGGGDGVNKGGGGGGSGGLVLLVVYKFAGTGNISALGGNGGNGALVGTNCGGGGGGGGGVVIITSNSISSGAISGQTISAAGGTAGNGSVGGGSAGSNGSAGTIILVAN